MSAESSPSPLRWVLILSLAALVSWRVVAVNLADFFVSVDRPAVALAWSSSHPDALYQQARALMDTDPEQARQLFRQAAAANPTDARIYMSLAMLPGEPAHQQALMAQALAFGPMRSQVQEVAAAFWAEQEDIQRSLWHLGKALTLVPELEAGFFPKLLTLATDPRGEEALSRLLDDPPRWWPSFVDYATANAQDPRVAVFLFRQLEDPEPWRREQLLARLESEGLWQEAYFVWLNGLSEDQLASLANLYNGSFEEPLGGRGFGWRYEQIQGVSVDTLGSYGSRGKSLRVAFSGSRFRFQHLLQPLLLPPGDYLLSGRVRPEGLKARKGILWSLSCVSPRRELSRSEAFLGSADWREFIAPFRVPEGCRLQELRLQQEGEYIEEYRATGAIWFDDLRIERHDPLAPRLAQ